MLNRQQKFEEAIKMTNMALTLDPNNPRIISDLAFSYGNLGWKEKSQNREAREYFDSAYALYKKVRKIGPLMQDQLFQWSITLFYDGKYKDSLEKLNKAKKLGFNAPKGFVKALNSKLDQ